VFVTFCNTCRLLPFGLHFGPRHRAHTLHCPTAHGTSERNAKLGSSRKDGTGHAIEGVSGLCEGRAGLLRRRGAAAAVRDVQPARTPRPLNVSLNGRTHRLSNCRYDSPPGEGGPSEELAIHFLTPRSPLHPALQQVHVGSNQGEGGVSWLSSSKLKTRSLGLRAVLFFFFNKVGPDATGITVEKRQRRTGPPAATDGGLGRPVWHRILVLHPPAIAAVRAGPSNLWVSKDLPLCRPGRN